MQLNGPLTGFTTKPLLCTDLCGPDWPKERGEGVAAFKVRVQSKIKSCQIPGADI